MRSKSKVERLTQSLNRLGIVLFFLFVIAAIASVAYVNNEWDNDAPIWRYVIAISSTSGFLIAAVLARVGAALVETLGRVRASLMDAILEDHLTIPEIEDRFPETHIG